MFAVYATHPEPTNPIAALAIGQRPTPQAGDGEVAVSVRAASVNMHDVFTLRGVGIRPDAFPMILGMDGAGVLPDGSEVIIHPVVPSPGWEGDETLDPRRTLLTERLQGTFADTVVLPERNVIPKPPELSFAAAACLGTAWLTAYRMLFVKSGLRAGQTMLVQGCSGGVSTALIQLGAAVGVHVWATGRSEEKRELAKSLGAHATFPTGERLPDRVDAVFDSVGKATWSHTMKALKPGGIVVTCGATTGDATAAELQRTFFLQLRVTGSTMGTRQELCDLVSFLQVSGVRPRIGATFPMAQADKGIEAMIAGETAGKIVLSRS